jgi:hypothetical protein
MDAARNNRPFLRRRTLARLIGPLFLLAGGLASAAGPDGATGAATAQACGCGYSIINLDPEGGMAALLNEKGQAAFGSFVFGTTGFFDGERVHPLGTLPGGGSGTLIRSLNNRGVVAGYTLDASEPFSNLYAFRWTVAGGMRAIPGSLNGDAYGINDRNQAAGSQRAGGVSARAVRWDPDGRTVNLGPLPVSLSEALAINDHALAGGYADFPDGRIHATLWDPAGRLTDLGTLGGARAFTYFVNERGEAAGYSDNATNDLELGFFWSPRGGIVTIGAEGGYGRFVADLNDRGEVAGNTGLDAARAAYLWSRARGLVLLPRGDAIRTDVFDLNNRSQMVGLVERNNGDQRAVRWDGLSAPVDLNKLMVRPPAGLVLEAGAAINDAGTILAYSNAGLVMLRPGPRGTDAPVLGPVTGLPQVVSVGQEVRLNLGFVDNSRTQTHTATASWTDNCASPHPLVREAGGVGEVSFQHRFCAEGYNILTVRVTDSGGRTTEVRKDVMVNVPGSPTISGQGTLARPPGAAGARARPLHFALWAPLGGAALAKSGNAQAAAPFVGLDGPFHFRSDQVGPPARDGQTVRLEGSGRLNGRPGYRFLLEAIHGSQAQPGGDRMRVRVSHTDANGADAVDYDNGGGAAARTMGAPDRTVVERGAITLGN